VLGQRLRELVAVSLLVMCPASLLAERPGAVLYSTGTVTLNGAPAATSMTVFAGDRIDTADASVVSLSRSGFSLVVDPNSSLLYQNDGFTILKGKAQARTSNGMSAQSGPLSVIPKANSALFDITREGKTVYVVSREGPLTLTDGVETATLQPGYTAIVTILPEYQEPKPAAAASGQQPSRPPQPQPAASTDQDQGPKPAATTRGEENKHKKLIIILIIVSAAAAFAIVCSLECGRGGVVPVSPVTP